VPTVEPEPQSPEPRSHEPRSQGAAPLPGDVAAEAWSGVHRGPLRPGEWVRLTDQKGRRHNFELVPGKRFFSNRGHLEHDDLIGREEGFTVASSAGGEYLVFRPLLSEFVVSMPRGAAVVYPKDSAQIVALAERLGWPVLADPLSGCRSAEPAVAGFDALLRHAEFARAHTPELVVRFGRPPASKVLSQWIVASGAPVLQVGGPGVIDPDRNVSRCCCMDDLATLSGATGTPWLARWRHRCCRRCCSSRSVARARCCGWSPSCSPFQWRPSTRR